MALSAAQVKGRIKNLASANSVDPRILLRMYMMERFLERISVSQWKENFTIKGGYLVSSLAGVANRTTNDLDTSIKNFKLERDECLKIVNEISSIDLNDGVTFKVKDVSSIMDEMEYPGVRIYLDAYMPPMVTPIKIDISTGDVITPGAVMHEYNLFLEDRTISLNSYNLETVLAEKMQTALSRGVLNSRIRDFYDIYILEKFYYSDIDYPNLLAAFNATCNNRGYYIDDGRIEADFAMIADDEGLRNKWMSYCRKYDYASSITYDDVIGTLRKLLDRMVPTNYL